MASKKPSANAKRIAAFKASADDFSDLFARETERLEEMADEREAARRDKACESKNRYSSHAEAEQAVAWCADHGKRGLRIYRCKYCNGWHLTSRPE
ncbi:MAG: hypothetical protein IJ111_15225 [Eggerthellaceae bacterium]|nr:hypothetical protein [Eggerthellaceae bacterium]MBQ9044154.1 hypothetical protein [Eggerthellaceae bacterium]